MTEARTAVVTGAGSGIGRAIALRLHDDGFDVLAVDRRPEPLAETLACAHASGRMSSLVQDVTSDGAPDGIMDACLSAGRAPAVLVNNAGLGNAKRAVDTSDEELDRYIAVNFRSVFRLSRAFAACPGTDGGCIVNIASVFGEVGFPGTAPYSAAKAAVIGLTRQMAADCAARRIRVNAIAPGLIATPATADRMNHAARFRRLTIDQIPAGRPGLPEEVAGAASFLCSKDAAYVNGAVLVVDGGWTATRFLAED
jgi:meso-butanediol dehydrogenase/(S,S)-butanediol dehydrogenase/diacetyl reductase